MLIVHIVRQFDPGVGGLENVVRELAAAQVEAGHRVRVLTLDRLFNDPTRRRLPARESLAGIEIVRISYFGSSRYPIALSAIRHVKDADLVHVHAIDFFFDYLALTKPLHRRTLVVSTHGGFFHTNYAAVLKRIWFQTVTRLSLKSYAGVAAVSASDFERFSSIRSSGMVCIENGADISIFRDAAAENFQKSIFSLGRFAENKRIDRLIEFVGALRRYDPEWRLIIAGRPDDLRTEDVRALVANAGLDGAVDVIASPNHDEIRTLMRKSSFYASASEYEGFGLAAVEGMSAGLFPLLSEIPPFHRLISCTGLGITIDYSLPDAGVRLLLESLPTIVSSYRKRRAECMQASRGYDWPGVCREYSGFYDAVTGTAVRTILDVPVQVLTFDKAVAAIDRRFDRRDRVAIAFANAHTLNVSSENDDFRRALQNSFVLNDGIGVDIASQLLYGSPFPENLNGTDFGPNYLRATRHHHRIFLLGAEPGTAESAAERLASLCPRHAFVGCRHGHFDAAELPAIIAAIRQSKADLLLVAMGNPIQELFIHKHLAATGCTLGMGVGALFDFLAGNVPRATPWMQRWHIEWIYRLAREPHRLARRYLVGNPLFLMRIARQFWSGARVNHAAPFPLDGLPQEAKRGSYYRTRAVAGRRRTNIRKQQRPDGESFASGWHSSPQTGRPKA